MRVWLWLFLIGITPAHAASVTFGWDAVTTLVNDTPLPEGALAGYVLQWGIAPGGPYATGQTETITETQTTVTVTDGPYYFTVIAKAGDGYQDSAESNEIRWPVLVTGLTPAVGSQYAADQASVTISIATESAATCRIGLVGEAWAAMATMAGAETDHTATVTTVPGGVYQRCVKCRDGNDFETDSECTHFFIRPKPKAMTIRP